MRLLKHGETSLQPLTVNALVEEVLQLSRNSLIGHGITVHRSLAPNVPPIQGDYIQLQQVLLNLILNACDAMAANPPAGRELTMATAHRDGAVRIFRLGHRLRLAAEHRISLATGLYHQARLGSVCSICRSIVTAHKAHGNIGAGTPARCRASRGATFHLELPYRKDDDSERPPTTDYRSLITEYAAAPPPAHCVTAGILLLDDQPGMLDALTRLLKAGGLPPWRIAASTKASESYQAAETQLPGARCRHAGDQRP